MEIKDILSIITPLCSFISAVATLWIGYFVTVRVKKSESILKFKEEKYANLLVLLQGFIGETNSRDTKKRFFEEQYKSWVYASDDVVHAMNDLVKLLIEEKDNTPNPQKGRQVIGNIVLQMRKDLLGETELKENDFKYTSVE